MKIFWDTENVRKLFLYMVFASGLTKYHKVVCSIKKWNIISKLVTCQHLANIFLQSMSSQFLPDFLSRTDQAWQNKGKWKAYVMNSAVLLFILVPCSGLCNSLKKEIRFKCKLDYNFYPIWNKSLSVQHKSYHLVKSEF